MPRAIEIVRRVAPGARENYCLAFERGDALLKKHGITTPPRLAHFLAQVLHETGGLTIERENGNYRAQRLLEIFGVGNHSAGVTAAEASELAHHPEAIFERVYGLGNPKKAKELGNVNPGDGYRYCGGGILQTTGRGNYRRMGQKCGVDFEAHPELVLSAEHALKPALAEWSEGNLNAAADRDDIVAITRRINGGLNGLDDRRAWLAKLRPLIKSVELIESADIPPTPGSPDLVPHDLPEGLAPPGRTSHPIVLDLAQRVVAAMERKGHTVDRGQGEINLVYIEGMNPDGTPNGDEANKWNDLRLVIRFEHGRPRIIGLWAATTEPGRYFTENPINPNTGAARIEFGQYKAWQVGMHRGNHESLVQTGGTVTVCRDLNKDGARTGDKRDTGHFGINQHWGYDLAEVDKASAGCLVGQSKTGHRAFMSLVKSDPRYQADRKHVFATSILPESDVLAVGAVEPMEEPADDAPPPETDGGDRVRRLQKLLGFSEQEQDGLFGAITEEAVKQFQRRHGLPVTGDPDEKTWDALEREAAGAFGISPPGAKPGGTGETPVPPGATPVAPSESPLKPNLGLGAGTMNPLIAIAASVLPDIIKTIAGDRAGTVSGAVTNAVTEITRTQNPQEASNKLAADPAAKAALQLKLAEIAADQEEKRQQAQLAVLKAQYEDEAKKREAKLEELRAQIEDTKNARATFGALAQSSNPMAWGAPIVSFIVTLGFFRNPDPSHHDRHADGRQCHADHQYHRRRPGGGIRDGGQFLARLLARLAGEGCRDDPDSSRAVQSSQCGDRDPGQANRSPEKDDAGAGQAGRSPAIHRKDRDRGKACGRGGENVQFPTLPRHRVPVRRRIFRAQGGSRRSDSVRRHHRSLEGVASGRAADSRGSSEAHARGSVRDLSDALLECPAVRRSSAGSRSGRVRLRSHRRRRAVSQDAAASGRRGSGPATVAATRAMSPRDVVTAMSQQRLEHYRNQPAWPTLGKDWTNRTNAVEKSALDMIAAATPAAVA
jgi:putative chitinase